MHFDVVDQHAGGVERSHDRSGETIVAAYRSTQHATGFVDLHVAVDERLQRVDRGGVRRRQRDGQALTAGAGLQLVGTTFSIPTNGISAAMLASDSGSLAKVSANILQISGSNIGLGAASVGVGLHEQRDLERDRDEPISDAGDRDDNPSVRTRGSELSSRDYRTHRICESELG